jgi:radical SAM superfamily enzyme YgiQ (UPF0313 family)
VVLFNGVDGRMGGGRPWLPLSILTLGSALQAADSQVVLIDPQVHDRWRDMLARALPGAAYLGVTCMTGPSITTVMEAISICRETAPDVPVAWGGYHATLASGGILRERLADVVVRGVGEPAAIRLVDELGSSRRHLDAARLRDIPNLAFLDAGGSGARGSLVRTRTEYLADINELPPADYDLLDPRQYYTETVCKVPYITSYGCPHACSYCSEPTTSGRRWRPLRPRRVVDESRAICQRYETDTVDFMDPNFSSNPRRVVEFVAAVEADDGGVRFMCNMRARDVVLLQGLIDVGRLAKAGFARIFLGVESGSDTILADLRKGSTVQDTLTACAALSRAGIETYTSFMHDLPGEGTAESQMTLNLARALARLPGNLQSHHFYMPFPGTELYNRHFASELDFSRTQADWAMSSTKGGATGWRRNRELRCRVREELGQLRTLYPSVFAETSLPEV